VVQAGILLEQYLLLAAAVVQVTIVLVVTVEVHLVEQ
jgi:hypothetical protein